ncbi:hypothetical protein C8J57DRAFT_1564543 [Mycena rebaudengoi]|nr:hypothetical protein C8J57DRAFT_1564543 [Mycena rebaudengoi]
MAGQPLGQPPFLDLQPVLTGSPPESHGPSFEFMFAPLLIGVVFNVMLFGVFVVQVHSYFHLYKSDHRWMRSLVIYLIVMEVINTVCDVGLIYEPLITLRNSASAMITSPKLLIMDPIVTVFISTPTQLFMAWRIRRITKSKWFSGLVALMAFTSFGVMIQSAASPPQLQCLFFATSSNSRNWQPPITIWLTSSAFADLFITVFLVNFIWTNKTGFSTQTDSVADRIILLTIQTGVLTSFAAIADVTVFLVVPNSTLQFIWDFSIGKLYSISLISTLNARAEWNNLLDDVSSSSDKEKHPNGIIKIRKPTDIQGLQLYIPSNFEISASHSPRKRTPKTAWMPHPLPPVAKSNNSYTRTAEWARTAGK